MQLYAVCYKPGLPVHASTDTFVFCFSSGSRGGFNKAESGWQPCRAVVGGKINIPLCLVTHSSTAIVSRYFKREVVCSV
ncbi:hypothetical protein J6590_035993 [Homalodisca vitripennis]|nr:hypothetical protein J6590_035993 [Homalodisca vitripennis]